MSSEIDALVIGSGPAGLMAAQELATAGRQVLVVDAKPSLGRKFLMAGKSGLNLTKNEPLAQMLPRFGESSDALRPMLKEFDTKDVQKFATDLGQEIFTGSSGRVFPKAMKSSPLLRAWIVRLAELGVEFRVNWRWQGWAGEALVFETRDGPMKITPNVCVLALGGASWSRLGSDAKWAEPLGDKGVELTPFAPTNVGLSVDWSPYMEKHFGSPIKAVSLCAKGVKQRGEFVISRKGLEGGGIYAMSKYVRANQPLTLDLLPDWSFKRVKAALQRPRKKATLINYLRKVLRLSPAKLALLVEFGKPLTHDAKLVGLIKTLPIKHQGLRPIDEAISTAGGVAWSAVNQELMLRSLPGIFVAGEMLDWEAPTGGYLITGCFATGKWAGRHAANWNRTTNE